MVSQFLQPFLTYCFISVEHIVYSVSVNKYNRFGMKQARNMLLTTHQLYNVKNKDFQRSIGIQKIKALTKSSDNGNFEFIVHVKNEYDYRFTSDSRDELFEHIKACYFHCMNANLPVYMVPGKVKEYETSKKDVKNGVEKLPPDSFLQRSEDIYEPLVDE